MEDLLKARVEDVLFKIMDPGQTPSAGPCWVFWNDGGFGMVRDRVIRKNTQKVIPKRGGQFNLFYPLYVIQIMIACTGVWNVMIIGNTAIIIGGTARRPIIKCITLMKNSKSK